MPYGEGYRPKNNDNESLPPISDEDAGPADLPLLGELTKKSLDATNKLQYMLLRQDEAYRKSPYGSWAERWIPGICKHTDIRCTHGDEIIHHRYRRRVCMVCGKSLKGPIPDMCFFTGEPHIGSNGVMETKPIRYRRYKDSDEG